MNDKLLESIQVASNSVERALDSEPTDGALYFAAHSTMHYAAHAHMKSCEVFKALPYRERAVEYARKAVELDPRNRDYRTNLANAIFAYAQMYLLQGASSKAVQSYVEALKIQTELLSEDPDNEYLQSRRRQTLTELLASITFHPGVVSEMQATDYKAAIALESSIGLSPTLDMYLIDRGVATRNSRLVQQALGSLEQVLSDSESENQRVQLVSALKHLSERALDTTFVSNLPSVRVNEGESCNARLMRWAGYELSGDYDEADATLQGAKGLGLSGMALGFYSDLLRGQRK
jgi:tetratricopeptide (TPR) repeat protein